MQREALRQFISTALLHRDEISLSEFYLLEQRAPPTPLEKGQCALLRHLLGLKVDLSLHPKEKNLMREMERAFVFACLGEFHVLSECASEYLQTEGMHSFRMGEDEYDAVYFSALEKLMLASLGLISHEGLEGILPPHLEAIKNYLFPRLPAEGISLNDSLKGTIAMRVGSLQMAFTCQGQSSGFGAIYKEKAKILTFGPCFFPLGVSDHFGIFRTSDLCQDVVVEESPLRFSGWARASYQKKPTDLWTFIDFSLDKEMGELKVKFNACSDFTPCAFVFFVEAEKALINEKQTLRPGTLDRYQEGSAPVVFGDNALAIRPLFQSEMQLIPLSGGAHYWGAGFLLAFVITDETKTYSFEIK